MIIKLELVADVIKPLCSVPNCFYAICVQCRIILPILLNYLHYINGSFFFHFHGLISLFDSMKVFSSQIN